MASPNLDGGASPQAVLIAGPTASGKSALAMRLAAHLGGVVVNADSMQVYGVMRVLTARPSAQDEAAVPHALYGNVDPARAYNVAEWLADVRALMETEARPLVFVGGTGLYFEALLDGLSAVPPVPDAIRARWRALGEADGAAALHAALATRDPIMAARLHPHEPQRLARALEVWEATGRSLADWQCERTPPLLAPDTPRLLLTPDRAVIRARIAARFDIMLETGAMGEARAMAARDLGPATTAMKALGLPPLLSVLRGEMSMSRATELAVRDSRRYAKRQDSWGRTRMGAWPRLTPDEATALSTDDLLMRMTAINP